MRIRIPLFMLALSITCNLQAAKTTLYVEDTDLDEVFELLVEIDNSVGATSTGLASYDIRLSGLSLSGIDPTTIEWQQNYLENFDSRFMQQGFLVRSIEESILGANGYQVRNRQIETNSVFGIGIESFAFPDNPFIPIDPPFVDLPALLGTLEIPGANQLDDQTLAELFTNSNFDLFTSDDPLEITQADSGLCIIVDRGNGTYEICVPEPTSSTLGLLGLTLLTSYRRHS